MKNKPAACPAIWFSGFFGLGALVHLIRLIGRFSAVIAGYEIPLSFSVAAVIVFGALSIGLLIVGTRRPCCEGEEKKGTCH